LRVHGRLLAIARGKQQGGGKKERTRTDHI
jgi:hypothetical protein